MKIHSKTTIRCSQCGEPILPGEVFLDTFQVGAAAPLHEECFPLFAEDEDRRNYWFENEEFRELSQ